MTECLDSHQTLTENIINMSLKAKFTHKINTNAVDFQAAANDLSMKIGVKIDRFSYLIVWIEQVDDLFIVEFHELSTNAKLQHIHRDAIFIVRILLEIAN